MQNQNDKRSKLWLTLRRQMYDIVTAGRYGNCKTEALVWVAHS
ncbi:MAG: hypothetical protein ACXW2E_09295 [Nitrososphaeraceae archaeon]